MYVCLCWRLASGPPPSSLLGAAWLTALCWVSDRPWWSVWQLALLVSPCVGPWRVGAEPSGLLSSRPGPVQSRSPGVLVVADLLVSALQTAYNLNSRFLLHICATKEQDMPFSLLHADCLHNKVWWKKRAFHLSRLWSLRNMFFWTLLIM